MIPSAGEIYNGYRFLGGDPNDEKSWEKFDLPRQGDIVSGYRFLGGDPNKQDSWRKREEPSTELEEAQKAATAGQEYWTGGKPERQREEAVRTPLMGMIPEPDLSVEEAQKAATAGTEFWARPKPQEEPMASYGALTTPEEQPAPEIARGRFTIPEPPKPPDTRNLLERVSGVVDPAISRAFGDTSAQPGQIVPEGVEAYQEEQRRKAQEAAQLRLGVTDTERSERVKKAEVLVASILRTAGSSAEWLGRRIDSDSISSIAETLDRTAAALTPEQPTILDKVVMAGGSTGLFIGGGIAVSKALPLIGFTVGTARTLGIGTSAVLESSAIAQETYEKAMAETGNEELADTQAIKAAAINLPLSYVTNKLGIFSDKGGRISRTARSIGVEGGQEGLQEGLTNYLGFKPVGEGVTEAVFLGAVAGGGIKFTVDALNLYVDQAPPQEKAEIAKQIIADGVEARQKIFAASMSNEEVAPLLREAGITSPEDPRFIALTKTAGEIDKSLAQLANEPTVGPALLKSGVVDTGNPAAPEFLGAARTIEQVSQDVQGAQTVDEAITLANQGVAEVKPPLTTEQILGQVKGVVSGEIQAPPRIEAVAETRAEPVAVVEPAAPRIEPAPRIEVPPTGRVEPAPEVTSEVAPKVTPRIQAPPTVEAPAPAEVVAAPRIQAPPTGRVEPTVTPTAPEMAAPAAPETVPERAAIETPEPARQVILQNRNRATPASVAQMTSIAAKPDYGRLGFSRDFANGAPVVFGGEISQAQLGNTDTTTAQDGRKINVQYAVVDADKVLASNRSDGTVNQAYGDLNIKGTRAVAGNGRIAGLQTAYENKKAGPYRKDLADDALHGIDKNVIRKMKRPVLVRVMSEQDVTPDIGDVSNVGAGLALSSVEQAKNDANRINLEDLTFTADGRPNNKTVTEFVRSMPASEQGALIDTNGIPTAQAVDRLNAAIFSGAYKNDELVRLYAQAQDPEAKLVLSALAQVAPKMVRLEGAGDLDLRSAVTSAAEAIVNGKRQGLTLDEIARQRDITVSDPAVGEILNLFARNPRSAKAIVRSLGRAADVAYQEANKPSEDMFGEAPKMSRADIVENLEEFESDQGELYNIEGERRAIPEPSPEAVSVLPRTEGRQAVGERDTQRQRVTGEGRTSRQSAAQPSKIDPSPEEAIAVERGVENKPIVEAADWIAENTTQPDYKVIGKRIARRLRELEDAGVQFGRVNIARVGDKIPKNLTRGRGMIRIEGSGKDIKTDLWLNGSNVTGKVGTSYYVSLHELAHAATAAAIRAGADQYAKPELARAVKRLNDVHKTITKELRRRNKLAKEGRYAPSVFEQQIFTKTNNAFANTDETIAWALTKKEAQDWLESVPYKGGNLWTEFVTAVRTLLGLPAKANTALSEVLSVAEDLMTVDAKAITEVGTAEMRAEDISDRPSVVNWAKKEFGDRVAPNGNPVWQNFVRWFGDSQVVNEKGEPLVMYHGTFQDFEVFNRLWTLGVRQRSMDTVGSWFSDNPGKGGAEGYGSTIMPAFLKAKKLKTYNNFDDFLREMHEAEGRDFSKQTPKGIGSAEGLRAKLKAEGYDGIIFPQNNWTQLKSEEKNLTDAILQVEEEYRQLAKRFRDVGLEMTGRQGRPFKAKIDKLVKDRQKVRAEISKSGLGQEWAEQTAIVVFEPDQIKSSVGNNGNFSTEPSIVQNLNRPYTERAAFQGYEQTPGFIQPSRRLRTILEKLDSEKISEGQFIFAMRQLSVEMSKAAQNRADVKERERGADIVREKLIAARRRGELDSDLVDFALWLLDQNPGIASGLGISVKGAKDGITSGQYNPASAVMTVFKQTGNIDTGVHEILHHSERMMPKEVQAAIRAEWERAYGKALANAEGKERDALLLIMDAMAGSPTAKTALLKAFKDGTLNYDKHYQLVNPSEFWAVNASRILRRRYEANSWIAKAKNWLSTLVEKAKAAFGLRSDAPIIRGLEAVMSGKANEPTGKMLSNLSELSNIEQAEAYDPQEPSKIQKNVDNIIRKFQDRNIDVKNVIEMVKEKVGKLLPEFNPYLQEGLSRDRKAAQEQYFERHEFLPLMLEMAKRKVTIREFEEYLHARHAPDYNREMEKRNPNKAQLDQKLKEIKEAIRNAPQGSKEMQRLLREEQAWQQVQPFRGTEAERNSLSGMSTEEAEKHIRNIPKDKLEDIKALASKVDEMIRKSGDMVIASGADPASIRNDNFGFYVPLKREGFEERGGGYGQGFSITGKFTKTSTGSNRKVVDILANIAEQRMRAINRAENARVSASLLGLVLSAPNPELWSVDTTPMSPRLDRRTGAVVMRPDPDEKQAANVIVVRLPDGNGGVIERQIVFNINNDTAMRIADAFKRNDADTIGEGFARVAIITRWFANMSTQYNPIFGGVNFVRDLQSSAVRLTATPLAGKQKELISTAIKVIPSLYADLRARRKGLKREGTYSQIFREFEAEGGRTLLRNAWTNSADKTKELQKIIDRASEQSAAGKAVQLPGKVKDIIANWLTDYNDTLESAIRVAAYKMSREQGISKPEAAMIAKDITVNFSRRGSNTDKIGALYAFFNASVQGTANMADTMDVKLGKNGVPRMGRRGQKIVAGGVLLGVIQSMLYALADYEEGEPPDFVKEKNFIIPFDAVGKIGNMAGLDIEERNNKYFSIPLALGYNVLPNLGRLAGELAFSGFKDPEKKAGDAVKIAFDAFSPVGGELSWQTATPTAVDPIIALIENKDWTGKPIYRESLDRFASEPGFKLAKDNASYAGVYISRALNYMSGGTEYSSGVFPTLLSPTPDQIDYLIGQAFGGVGREITKIQKTISSQVTGEELPAYSIPVVSRLFGEVRNQASHSQIFYDNVKLLIRHEQEIKGREEQDVDPDSYIAENPEAEMADQARSVMREVQKLRKEKREKLAEGIPREEVREYDEEITQIMAVFNAEVKALKELR